MAEYLAFQENREAAMEAVAWSVLVGGAPVEYWMLTARIERVCGRRIQAGELLDKGLDRLPDNVPLLRERADEYEMQGQHVKAVEVLEHAVELKPDWPDLRLRLARAFQELDERDLSLGQFEKALELNPRYESAARGRAELLKDHGRTEEAEALLEAWREDKLPHAVVYRMLSEIYADREDYRQAEHFARLSQAGGNDEKA
jgi:tetratricopeptide (TPR) repeat protein